MTFYKDKIILSAYILSILLLVIAFSLVFVGLFNVETMLIIHFNPFAGIDFLGERQTAYGILISGLAINILNSFLSAVLYSRDKFLSYLPAFGATFISLLILIVISVIVGAN